MVIAALGSKLEIPDAIYKFIVFMLLIKVGLSGGIAIRNGNLAEMLLPALFAVVTGVLIVFIGRYTLAKLPNVKTVDAIATGGLFGAVSGFALAALTGLEEQGKTEKRHSDFWIGLYGFNWIVAWHLWSSMGRGTGRFYSHRASILSARFKGYGAYTASTLARLSPLEDYESMLLGSIYAF
jgi:hypothetical protein